MIPAGARALASAMLPNGSRLVVSKTSTTSGSRQSCTQRPAEADGQVDQAEPGPAGHRVAGQDDQRGQADLPGRNMGSPVTGSLVSGSSSAEPGEEHGDDQRRGGQDHEACRRDLDGRSRWM